MTANDPAFPHPSGAQGCDGLTKREWFAGMALQGLLANSKYLDWAAKSERPLGEFLAASALGLADDLLSASGQVQA